MRGKSNQRPLEAKLCSSNKNYLNLFDNASKGNVKIRKNLNIGYLFQALQSGTNKK